MNKKKSTTPALFAKVGRSYSGGVLTFESSKIEEIPSSILNASKVNYEEIDHLIRDKKIEDPSDIVEECKLP
jgi:hypothetical protein